MYRKVMTVISVSGFDTFLFVVSCYAIVTMSYDKEWAAVTFALWVGVLYRAVKELALRSVLYDAAVERNK